MSNISLICVRVADTSDVITGSSMVKCSQCNAMVWVAPSSVPILEHVNVVCIPCSGDKTEPVTFGGFLPGQLDEIYRHQKGDHS